MIDDQMMRTIIDETVLRAAETVPVPKVVPATVAAAADTGSVSVIVDGDTEHTLIPSVVGPLHVGERVMVLFNPPAGAMIIGATFDGSWQTPTLGNSWVVAIGGQVPQYRFEPGGTVRLIGTVADGAIGSAVFNLPAIYRPAFPHIFATDCNDLFGSLQIRDDGDVVVTVGSNVRSSLACTWPVPAT